MKNKTFKYVMLLLLALFALCLALGLYFNFNIIENPMDGVGGLHNLQYEMKSLLFFASAFILGTADAIMLVLFLIRNKKK